MAELVSSIEEVQQNALTLGSYRLGSSREREFFRGRIKNGKLFVVDTTNPDYHFTPSRFAGYKNNNVRRHERDRRDGRVTNVRLTELLGKPLEQGKLYDEIDEAFVAYCEALKIEPSRHHKARRYWLIGSLPSSRPTVLSPEERRAADLWEGTRLRTTINRYERDPAARRDCIARYGTSCSVCDFNFGRTYGEVGSGYIHVHHLVPLSTIGKRYKVDPIRHLRPVCANCHAMLHSREEVLGIDELRTKISQQRQR